MEEIFKGFAPLIEVTVGGQTIRTTAEHPFHVAGRGWTPAVDLREGLLLTAALGTPVRVQGIATRGESAAVYNMRVEGFHTYFVGCGEWAFGVWAHNTYKNLRNPLSSTLRASQLPVQKITQSLVRSFSQATGKGINIRVGNQKEAMSLLEAAQPRAFKNPTATYSKRGGFGWQIHPPEPNVSNDLPHLKFWDWTGKKSKGLDGHIFFDSLPTSFSKP